MPRLTLAITFLLVAVVASFALLDSPPAADAKVTAPAAKQEKLLRHVVLFKFKKSATKKQIQRVVDEFAKLPKKIDTIVAFEMGTDVSVEGKAKGFTHGFVVTFKSEKGRKIYLPHPAHKAFVKIVGPVLEDVLVFDYWTTQ